MKGEEREKEKCTWPQQWLDHLTLEFDKLDGRVYVSHFDTRSAFSCLSSLERFRHLLLLLARKTSRHYRRFSDWCRNSSKNSMTMGMQPVLQFCLEVISDGLWRVNFIRWIGILEPCTRALSAVFSIIILSEIICINYEMRGEQDICRPKVWFWQVCNLIPRHIHIWPVV